MDKDDLKEILSAPYDREDWHEVLREVFGVRGLLQKPLDRSDRLNDGKELAKAARELGSFVTSDGKVVGLYQVDLTNKPQIWRNRVGLRQLLKSILRGIDAALVVFVQRDKWRLSLVSEIRSYDDAGNPVEQKTEPKRFTYLLGKDETVRTTADRLFLLFGTDYDLDKLIDTFSVEKLTKAFFKRYKELFGSFSQHLADSAEYRELFLGSRKKFADGWQDPTAKPIRDFVKILLGRLVFLQFLQKKGWMGVPESRASWENGDANFLQNLFTATPTKSTFHSKVLRKLFFETLNRKRKNDVAGASLGSDMRIPYLNGGLFDTDISAHHVIDFPPKLFSALLDFFQEYNFTIDEDDPYDREVGIDPEMLGHIFENLLEENREKGAFYTPKEVVHYMCQESLIEYLATHLATEDRPAIELLVRKNQVDATLSEQKNAVAVDRLLSEVKVCDPAIGSGAFPMGLLREIFECRRLLYPYLKTGEVFHPAILKKEIIQNNIYGVDIDNGAVEIARLRFWLSLVVDEIEPAPLPNLDYKIMQGNSLLEQFDDISLVFDKTKLSADVPVERNLFGDALNPQTSLMDVLRVQQELGEFDVTRLETEFFDTDDPQQKAHIRDQLNRLERLVIVRAIKDREIAVRAEIQKVNAEISHKQAAVRADQRDSVISVSLRRKLSGLESQLRQLEASKARYVQIRPDNKPYFLWHLYFQTVVDVGGFDILIANPPYGIVYDESLKEVYETLYPTFKRNNDQYIAFWEQSINLLKDGGCAVLITPNTFLNGDYYSSFREYLSSTVSILEVTDYKEFPVFAVPTVFVAILLGIKAGRKGTYLARYRVARSSVSDFELGDVPISANSGEKIRQTPRLVARITSAPTFGTIDSSFFVKDIGFNYWTEGKGKKRDGDSIGDRIFYSGKQQRPTDVPFLKGRDISRWRYQIPTNWLKGNFADYLDPTKDTFRYSADFLARTPKLIYRQTSSSLIAAMDYDKRYLDKTVHVIVPRIEGVGISLESLLGLLNSKFFAYLYGYFSQEGARRAFAQVKTTYVKKLPVPIEETPATKQIAQLVGKILANVDLLSLGETKALEDKIDRLVYELFELNVDDVREVEIWFCDQYPEAAEAQGFAALVRSKYDAFFKHRDYVRSKPPEYWASHPTLEMIAKLETSSVEFKETFEVNNETGERMAEVLTSALKTVAGFANADGGTLLIGVSDAGETKGLDLDLALLNDPSLDKLQRKVRDKINAKLAPIPGTVKVDLEYLPDGVIIQVAVSPSSKIIRLNGEVYLREGNQTNRLFDQRLADWLAALDEN